MTCKKKIDWKPLFADRSMCNFYNLQLLCQKFFFVTHYAIMFKNIFIIINESRERNKLSPLVKEEKIMCNRICIHILKIWLASHINNVHGVNERGRKNMLENCFFVANCNELSPENHLLCTHRHGKN